MTGRGMHAALVAALCALLLSGCGLLGGSLPDRESEPQPVHVEAHYWGVDGGDGALRYDLETNHRLRIVRTDTSAEPLYQREVTLDPEVAKRIREKAAEAVDANEHNTADCADTTIIDVRVGADRPGVSVCAESGDATSELVAVLHAAAVDAGVQVAETDEAWDVSLGPLDGEATETYEIRGGRLRGCGITGKGTPAGWGSHSGGTDSSTVTDPDATADVLRGINTVLAGGKGITCDGPADQLRVRRMHGASHDLTVPVCPGTPSGDLAERLRAM